MKCDQCGRPRRTLLGLHIEFVGDMGIFAALAGCAFLARSNPDLVPQGDIVLMIVQWYGAILAGLWAIGVIGTFLLLLFTLAFEGPRALIRPIPIRRGDCGDNGRAALAPGRD